VVRAALLSAYELARLESTLKEAELIIQEVPAVVRCPVCETARPAVSAYDIRCAECVGSGGNMTMCVPVTALAHAPGHDPP